MTLQAVDSGLRQQAQTLGGVVAVEAHDERQADCGLAAPGQDAASDLVTARDAAEDVDQQRPHAGVRGDDVQSGGDALGARAAAHVAEVGRSAAGRADHVESAHDEPGAVAEDSHVALQGQVGDAGLPRGALPGVLVRPLGRQVRLPVQALSSTVTLASSATSRTGSSTTASGFTSTSERSRSR